MKNRDCPLGRGICTEKLRPTFQPIGVAILFRSNLFPCNEFIPYDGVALGVLAVDVLIPFAVSNHWTISVAFALRSTPKSVVYGLQSLFNDFRGYRLSVGQIGIYPFDDFICEFVRRAFNQFAPYLRLIVFEFPHPLCPQYLKGLFYQRVPPLDKR